MFKLFSFYLPQFHQIPENDKWWGPGFTEWTNVRAAKPQFPGHYQPQLPAAELGFYDLSEPSVMVRQAEMARRFGIYGFVFYHYWFHGQRLLEKPLNDLLANKNFDLPFCLCWANENWSRRWDGMDDDILMSQVYSEADDLAHMHELIKFFRDERYYKHRGRPVLLVYRSEDLPDAAKTAALWRREVRKAGFPDIYLLRVEGMVAGIDPDCHGFDAAVEFAPDWRCLERRLYCNETGQWTYESAGALPGTLANRVFLYDDVVRAMLGKSPPSYKRYPGVFPAWDNSARRLDLSATIIRGGSPESYYRFLLEVGKRLRRENERDDRLIFVNAWNEWGEGCHLEPDQTFAFAFLEASRAALKDAASGSFWSFCQRWLRSA